jgi:hypothetical protein
MKRVWISFLAILMCGCAGNGDNPSLPVIHANPGQSLKQIIDSLPANGGTVLLGLGTWTSGYQSGTFISKPDITIQGAGMPQYNPDYTAMMGGTILMGPVGASTGADHFTVRDLGVDAGPNYVKSQNGGIGTDALAIFNNGQAIGAPPVQSPVIENVACLGSSPTAQFHCMLVENVNNAYVHNVQTVMNCHGFVLKGTHSTVDGVYSRGHGIDSVIVKSDTYATSSQDTLANITIEPLISPGDTKGIIIIGVGAPVTNISFSNVTVRSPLAWGIYAQGASADTSVAGLSFSHVTIDYKGGSPPGEYCMQFVQYVNRVNISYLSCSNMWLGVAPYLVTSGYYDYTVTNSQFTNISTDAVMTYGGGRIFDSAFDGVGGNGIVNLFGEDFVCNNTFANVAGSNMLSRGGTFVSYVPSVCTKGTY